MSHSRFDDYPAFYGASASGDFNYDYPPLLYHSQPLERSSTSSSTFTPRTPPSVGSPTFSLESPKDSHDSHYWQSLIPPQSSLSYGGGDQDYYGDNGEGRSSYRDTYPNQIHFSDFDSSSKPDEFVCLFPGCSSGPFKRKADLERHYKNCHTPDEQREAYPCDYHRCQRRDEPFNRRDHYRDHLRDYHKEAIEKRGGRAPDEDYIRTRKVPENWWRCARCLGRVSIRESGYDCPNCRGQCSELWRTLRQSQYGRRS